jgi:2-hydroxy-4-carboxymuconate semialdehyde hemiacetal dehydrogenase
MKICLAGTGAMGVTHMKALRRIDGVEVVSINSRTAESGKTFAAAWKIPFSSTSLEECLDRPSADAVILATPSGLHPEQTMLALSKGKHVQVEIPMSLDLASAKRMHEAQKKAGKVCMVTHTRRFAAPHREIRRRIQEGSFHLHHIVVETYFLRRTNLNMHGQPRSWVDNLLWHHGCHSVDLAQWVLDDPDLEVWGQKGANHRELGIPMDMTIGMRSRKTGAIVTIALSFNNKGPFGGFYRYIGEEDTYRVFRDTMTSSDNKDVQLDALPAYDRQDLEFIDAIRTGREPEASVASCVPTMALLDKIQKSMDDNTL